LDEISRLLSHPKVGEISKKIDSVNPKREATTGKGNPDIFEILISDFQTRNILSYKSSVSDAKQ
jgi:hypothetical protein